MSDNERPATPFLFIPKDNSAEPGNERDSNAIGWISGPAIFLINENERRFEFSPRSGVDYRILALFRNAGAVPAQQAYVEFHIGMAPDGTVSTYYSKYFTDEPLLEAQLCYNLGVAMLNSPQGINDRRLSWAMSPKSHKFGLERFGWSDCETIAVVKLGDLVADRPPEQYNSRTDRHTAFRLLSPNFSGVWEGTEMEMRTGANLGAVKLEITQDWNFTATVPPGPSGATSPNLTIVPREFPTIPGRIIRIDKPCTDYRGINEIYFTLDIYIPMEERWDVSLEYSIVSEDTIKMRTFNYQTNFPDFFSEALLRRSGAAANPPDTNKVLLGNVRMDRSSTWPSSRLRDFEIMREAIINL